MVWYRAVWCDLGCMVWYGVVWCGVVWCGVMWCGIGLVCGLKQHSWPPCVLPVSPYEGAERWVGGLRMVWCDIGRRI